MVVKSKQRMFKAVCVILLVAAILCFVSGILYMTSELINNIYYVYPGCETQFASKTDFVMYVIGSNIDKLIVRWGIGIVLLAAMILIKKVRNSSYTLVFGAVRGTDYRGREVDLPLMRINGVEKMAFGGVKLNTFKGDVKFIFMKNRNEVYEKTLEELSTK